AHMSSLKIFSHHPSNTEGVQLLFSLGQRIIGQAAYFKEYESTFGDYFIQVMKRHTGLCPKKATETLLNALISQAYQQGNLQSVKAYFSTALEAGLQTPSGLELCFKLGQEILAQNLICKDEEKFFGDYLIQAIKSHPSICYKKPCQAF